ncbi:MAG: hypothetical protein H6817_05245 [Phycisphaerales bacterium]|nr:hypothetical protein [Phycisphaerales bacterium]
MHDAQNLIADDRSLGARLVDAPGMNWVTLGALVRTAADELAADRGAEHAADLVAHAGAMSSNATLRGDVR